MNRSNYNQLNALVCVILVNYNGFEDTIECIKSLKRITYSNVKIVVVDNGSTTKPDSAQYNFLAENSYYIESKENLGFSGGNNLGIEYAKRWSPDFYLLLNNDTVVENNFLDEMLCAYNGVVNKDKIGLICGKIKFYSQPDRFWFAGGTINMKTGSTHHTGYMEQDYGQYDYNKKITFATGCLWLIPKHTILSEGLLSEEYFLYCEDTDYCCRLLNAGFQILYVGSSCIYHKVSASTEDGSFLQNYYMVRNGLIILDRFVEKSFFAKNVYIAKYIKKAVLGKISWKALNQAIFDYYGKCVGKYKERL